ncbi:MAG TPA: exopolysaccharide biosynthesis polyprenyl glycosylphosphotransferase [Anaeromyxobacteraceae bacterium]|nr:exopolysaccharide biosynthesis polyprenyl glycosylphosphotransferase [Anaeromyxobacteraceae bacterium]
MVRVFNHWFSGRKAAFFVAEESVLVVSLLAGMSLGPVAHPLVTAGHGLGAACLRATIAALAFAGALYFGDLYDLRSAVRDRTDGRRLLRALGMAVATLAVAYLVLPFVLPMGWIPRRSLVLAAAGGALAVILARAAMPAVVGAPTRVLLIGTGARARQLARSIAEEADGLFEIVGCAETAPAGSPSADIDAMARRLLAEVVVVAVEDRRAGLPVDSLLVCRTRGVQVMSDSAFAEATMKRIPLDLIRPSALIFDEGFRASRVTRAVKRALDLSLGLLMLVASFPLMLFAAAAIAATDGSPVLYSQERVGRGGRSYRIWKFRTMRRDAEKGGAAWATARDGRVLPVGRILRRSRIDELPQLWNVLRGEMSFVGPRPERSIFLEELKARWPLFALRELVKPGLTGWAQLRYRYGSTPEEQAQKLEYDLYYIKNTSLFLDLVCLFHTVKIVLTGRGAR